MNYVSNIKVSHKATHSILQILEYQVNVTAMKFQHEDIRLMPKYFPGQPGQASYMYAAMLIKHLRSHLQVQIIAKQ